MEGGVIPKRRGGGGRVNIPVVQDLTKYRRLCLHARQIPYCFDIPNPTFICIRASEYSRTVHAVVVSTPIHTRAFPLLTLFPRRYEMSPSLPTIPCGPSRRADLLSVDFPSKVFTRNGGIFPGRRIQNTVGLRRSRDSGHRCACKRINCVLNHVVTELDDDRTGFRARSTLNDVQTRNESRCQVNI